MQQPQYHMTYFLEDVARYLMEKNHGDLQRCVFIFPNRRARLFFNHYLANLSDKPMWSPEYYTINDFVLKLSGLQLADQLNMVFRLFVIFRECSGSNESFDTFYFYCEMMLADFDDIDKYRVKADQIFKNISDIREIEDIRGYLDDDQIKAISRFWDICTVSKDSPEKQKFIAIWNLLLKIYNRFGVELTKDGLAYEGMAYRKAVDQIDSAMPGVIGDRQVIFAGFNALNHSEELIFDWLQKSGNALFFWDYDKLYVENELHEAGYFLRKYINKYPQPVDFTPALYANTEQKIRTIAVPSNIAQSRLIDQCLTEMDSLPVKNHSQTALILADENLLLPVINSLPLSVDKVNISMGYPVTETPAFAFINSLVDLHRNKKTKLGSETDCLYYHKDFFSILRHGFLSTISAIEDVRLFEKHCLEHNLVYIDASAITIHHSLLALIFRPVVVPEHFGNYLRDIIDAVATEKSEHVEQAAEVTWELEVLYCIHKILTQFDSQLRESGLKLQFQTILNLLRKIIRSVSVPFEGEPLSGLQIMGILETRTLDFENLIILSVNEGKLPKTGHAPSFIPYTLREGYGLPTIRHQDAIFSYYFYRLLHRAKNVTLVYNTRTEGLHKGEPSRFIQQLRYEHIQPVGHLDMAYKILPFHRIPMAGIHTEMVAEKLQKYLRPGGTAYLSPSAINTYLKCKLRFYYRYIEGINEPENVEENIEANVFGSILHKAMSILYNVYIGKEVGNQEIELLLKNEQLIESAVQQAFADEYFKRKEVTENDFQGRNLIVKKIVSKYVKGILEYDSKNCPFRILSLEEPVRFELPGADNTLLIAIGGIIDRLDVKNECIRVVDYKTGEKKNVFQSVEALFFGEAKLRNDAVFQTFLYAFMLEKINKFENIQPVLFFVREVLKPEFNLSIFQSVQRQKKPILKFSNFSGEFEAYLNRVLQEIFNPDASFEQTKDIDQCPQCPYNILCRVKC
jgi:RecB family exonuclease